MIISKFKNAFGISNLEFNNEVCFGDDNLVNYLIYAPNGTFKSSFAKAFYGWSKGENICDGINDINFIAEIEIDGKFTSYPNKLNNILVYSREISHGDEYIHSIKQLIMSSLDRISISKLNIELDHYSKKVKNTIEKSKVKYLDYEAIVNPNVDMSLVEWLLNFYSGLEKSSYIANLEKLVDIKKIKQKVYSVLDEKTFILELKAYQDTINSRINSEFYDQDFSEVKGQDLIKSLKETSFLNKSKKRAITINSVEYYDIKDIENLFNEKLNEIMKDPEIVQLTKNLQKNIGTSAQAVDFSSKIIKHAELALKLPLGREEVIYSFLKPFADFNFDEIIKDLNRIKSDLDEIYTKTSKNEGLFHKVIKEYVSIFQPVFGIDIKNTKECLSGNEIPNIVFKHSRDISKTKKYTKKQIENFLSSGEKSALYILDFMFKYNELKLSSNQDDKIIIILDDIVETFDYRNRAGFIQYIHELIEDKKNELIILTHNFEFYQRVYSSVLKDSLRSLVASTNENGVVKLEKNKRIHINMGKEFKGISSSKDLVSKTPFFRELSIMLGKQEVEELLTQCLHYKAETKSITLYQIKSLLKDHEIVKEFANFDDDKYLKCLLAAASSIKTGNYFDIKPKIILAIASRILIEKIAINDDISKLDGITENQTRSIMNMYSEEIDNETLDLLKKVLLLTPDFIHLNSFMYEPLVDIDPKELIELYKNIKQKHDFMFGDI